MHKLVLSNNEIHVWLANLRISAATNKYFRQSLLNECELVRAESFKFEQLKSDFIASHGYLRLVLSQYLGCLPNMIEYGMGKYGKPFIENQKTQHNIYFNMSHSQEMAVYAITLNTEIGIDVEKINTQIDIEDIIKHVLTPGEIVIFRNIKETDAFKLFYAVWTCKEAILKATGEGLNFPLNKLGVLTNCNGSLKISSTISHQHLTLQPYFFNSIPGYAIAIASTREDNILCYLDASNITLR